MTDNVESMNENEDLQRHPGKYYDFKLMATLHNHLESVLAHYIYTLSSLKDLHVNLC